MSRDEVFVGVRDILAEQLGVLASDISAETSFQEDLDADSLAMVQLILALEDRFGVKISDEEVQGLTTVGETVDFIHARM